MDSNECLDCSGMEPEDELHESLWDGYDPAQELEMLKMENRHFSNEIERLTKEVSLVRTENATLRRTLKKLLY
jgi:hypothetical protein